MASSFSVNCISLSAEDGSEGASARAEAEASLPSSTPVIIPSLCPFVSCEVVIAASDWKRWEGRAGSTDAACTFNLPVTFSFNPVCDVCLSLSNETIPSLLI